MITKVTICEKHIWLWSKVQDRLCQICVGDIQQTFIKFGYVATHHAEQQGTKTNKKNRTHIASSHLIEKLKEFISCFFMKFICV